MKSQRNGHWKQWNLGNQLIHSFFPPPVFLCTKGQVPGWKENQKMSEDSIFNSYKSPSLSGTCLWRQCLPSSKHPQWWQLILDSDASCEAHHTEMKQYLLSTQSGEVLSPFPAAGLFNLHEQIILHLESQSLDKFSKCFLHPNPVLFTSSSPWESGPAPFLCLYPGCFHSNISLAAPCQFALPHYPLEILLGCSGQAAAHPASAQPLLSLGQPNWKISSWKAETDESPSIADGWEVSDYFHSLRVKTPTLQLLQYRKHNFW